jgi:hypothetical protein
MSATVVIRLTNPARHARQVRPIIHPAFTRVLPRFKTAKSAAPAMIPGIRGDGAVTVPIAFLVKARKTIHGPILPTTMPTLAIKAAMRLGRYSGAAFTRAGTTVCSGIQKG